MIGIYVGMVTVTTGIQNSACQTALASGAITPDLPPRLEDDDVSAGAG